MVQAFGVVNLLSSWSDNLALKSSFLINFNPSPKNYEKCFFFLLQLASFLVRLTNSHFHDKYHHKYYQKNPDNWKERLWLVSVTKKPF